MATAAVVANADIWPPVRIGFRPDDQGFQPSLKPLSCSLLQSGWPRLRQACARQLAGGCPQLPGEQTPEVFCAPRCSARSRTMPMWFPAVDTMHSGPKGQWPSFDIRSGH
jgi:hypothetical protein